jgi:hypothetical protein
MRHTKECIKANDASPRELCICGKSKKCIVDRAYFTGGVITIGATDHSGSYAHNTHRVILKEETSEQFVAWPDPTDPRCSDRWLPGIDKPLQYPKFAWERL